MTGSANCDIVSKGRRDFLAELSAQPQFQIRNFPLCSMLYANLDRFIFMTKREEIIKNIKWKKIKTTESKKASCST